MSISPPQSDGLAINSRHVSLQFARRPLLQESRFLLDEIARRMFERLQYIRIAPALMIDAGCGPGLRYEALQQHYPKAAYIGVDSCAPYIEEAQTLFESKGLNAVWQKIRQQKAPQFVLRDMADTGLTPESAQLLWSNLALHWHPQPHRVIAEWRRLLSVGGLCMFSCFGPRTLIELREALSRARLDNPTMKFVDMHDFGDLLVDNGFADPVMDQEMITLSYRTPERLLQDIYALGGNPTQGQAAGLRSRQWYQQLCATLEQGRQADGLLHLSLEVTYGHAWRSGVLHRDGETRVALQSILRK